MKKLHVRKDDEVVVISGNDMVKKHQKPRRQGEAGQILEVEGAIYAQKVALYCPKCDAGRRSKVTVGKDGKKIRVCAKCGAEL